MVFIGLHLARTVVGHVRISDQPAIGLNFAGMRMIVDYTNTEEQHTRNDAMTKHLDRCSRQCRCTEGHVARTRRCRHTQQQEDD